jgi:hypothetical protein
MDGEFPKVAAVVDKACEAQESPVAVVGFNAHLLALVRHVVRDPRHEVLEVFTPDTRTNMSGRDHPGAMGVKVGDYFRGAIMPRRLVS